MTLPLLSALRMSAATTSAPGDSPRGAEVTTADGRALSLVSAKFRATAQGGIARVVLEQRFANPYDEVLRVTYRMPLPADGAVSAYAFEIADRTISGHVDRKAAARDKFERAIAAGHTAALLEQNRDDIFTQQIGNIPPREVVIAKITVDLRLAWLPEGEWELRFPTVIGPRYIAAADTVADARDTHVDVATGGISTRISIEVAIGDAITPGRAAASPTHGVQLRADGVLELRAAAKLDRDIVVRWPVAGAKVGLALEIARPASEAAHAHRAYGLLTIVPPSRESRVTAVARDLIILLDTSGSMQGLPLDQAKLVVPLLIETLGEGDRFELIEFSNEPRRYRREPVAATAREKADAIKWVRSRRAEGGTEMRTAVIDALAALRPGAQRQVVLVTDGYVGGEQQILRVLHDRLPVSCRLHVLGVGAAVNRSLAIALARAGRGAEVLVGPGEDPERSAKRLVDRTRMPVLTNIEITGSALVDHAPEHVPDVFEGSPVVAALACSTEGGELVVRGDLAGAAWEQRVRVPARRAGDGNQAIVGLYGREHVADLESRAAMEHAPAIDREIEETGVTFQIATRLTSWVAVDASRKLTHALPTRTEHIPQELPYGTSAAAFGLRAASAPAQMMKTLMVGSYDIGESDYSADESTGESYAIGDGSFSPPTAPGLARAPSNAPSAPSKTMMMGGGSDEFESDGPTGSFPSRREGAVSGKSSSEDRVRMQYKAPADPFGASSPFIAGAAPMATSRPPAAKHRARLWLFLVLVMALIAALVWWLVL